MERKTVYLLMLLVGFAEAAFVIFLALNPDYVSMIFFVAFYFPAIAVMVLSFLPRIRMGVAPGAPNEVRSTMSLNFRMARYRVSEKGESFSVQGGTEYGIRIYLRPIGPDSIVLVRSDPTPTGWGVLLLLLIFTYGVGTVPYALYLFFKSQRFGLSAIPVMYKRPGETIVPGTPSKTKVCLIDTLSEGYRLSSEAYESAKSNYEDSVLLIVLGGFITFVLVLLTSILFLFPDIESGTSVPASLALGLAAALSLSITLLAILRRRSKKELQLLREWSVKMREELSNEVSNVAPTDRHKSTFEVILEASREMPIWLRVRQKSGFFRHPVYWTAIAAMVMYGLMYLVIALIRVWAGSPNQILIAAVSVSLLAIGLLLYFHLKRNEVAESQHITETWKRRTDAIQRKMEEMLRDL